jgi:amino acid transporter
MGSSSRRWRVHPSYNTPHIAISLAAVLGILLVLARTYEQLADMFVTAILALRVLGRGDSLRLRRTRPDLERPYASRAIPSSPIFIAGVIYLIINAFVEQHARHDDPARRHPHGRPGTTRSSGSERGERTSEVARFFAFQADFVDEPRQRRYDCVLPALSMALATMYRHVRSRRRHRRWT